MVKDTDSKKPLQGVTATISGTAVAASSDSSGKVVFNNIAAGNISIVFSYVGYKTQTVNYRVPGTVINVQMEKNEDKAEEEVIVTSSRTNSRIEDLPTKVEVLGSEEVGEENGIKPGNIASLLGDVAGIQIQQSNAATGNADARVQGLPGKYTQILRDGLPLFGGYSGSFSILQIPPSDLKQIEIVKGASSTLYGGGAIAGMINLVSKSPKLNSPERSVTINQTSLKESNINAYFSDRNKNVGYTFFSGYTYQRAVDVNKDGLSDVPDLNTFFFHPKLFIYPNKKQQVTLGYNLTFENRNGGDMQVLHHTADATHQFFIRNKSLRNTVDALWENKISTSDQLTVKGTASFFNRNISTNVFGMNANQLSYYTEASYFKRLPNHNIVGGINVNGENFTKQQPDSTQFVNYHQTTLGAFVQDDWKIAQRFTAQAGFRIDHHNTYGNFALPRLSLLYKISSHFTTRLGGGLGYKTPTQFANDVDERQYGTIIYNNALQAEKSSGANWDINYKAVTNGWHLTVNQMFYVTAIKQPVVDVLQTNNTITFYNAGKPLNTKGFETYVAATHNDLEIYLGYTYTLAKQLFDPAHPNVSLSARNKFASVIAYDFSKNFRGGIEAAYTGKQYLDDNSTTSPYVFAAAMLRYDIKNISFVLNCENLFDYRQTRQETIYSGSISNPVFKQIWAPLDGRVVNFSVKINW
ncbi:MAG: TonB-dependent receptor [Bacteroidetes bacterium]|nr:TonB-dependent receptor [Bacteroidota bacterium]